MTSLETEAEAEKHSLEPLRARTYYKLERKKKKKKKNYLNKWCNGWNLRGEYKIPLCIMVIVTLPQSREMKALKKHYFFILLINSLKKKLWYLTIPLHLSVRQVSSKDYDSKDI